MPAPDDRKTGPQEAEALCLTDAKRFVFEAMEGIVGAAPEQLAKRLAAAYAPGARWRGPHPLPELSGPAALVEHAWGPLLLAFPDIERRTAILLSGREGGNVFVAALGHLCGKFAADWLSIPASGRPAFLRFAEFHTVQDGRIADSFVLWDLLDLMRQVGLWPVAPSLGTEEQWPAPITGDGLRVDAVDPSAGAVSLAQTLAMHDVLGGFDDPASGRAGLLAMPQKAFWHPKMMWYGPAGIGAARGLDGFVDCHQLPFRQAFRRRRYCGYHARIGDGAFSATAGWEGVVADHEGGGFMGLAPTGREVTMRVMDFYLHHEGLIRENWVPLDIIHLLHQMDVDLFDRMRFLARRRR